MYFVSRTCIGQAIEGQRVRLGNKVYRVGDLTDCPDGYTKIYLLATINNGYLKDEWPKEPEFFDDSVVFDIVRFSSP